MKAIIMAGGEGTRLRPLTCDIPKPMVPIMNRPVMEHAIRLLKRHGITQIGVTLQYMPWKIQTYFGDGSALGVNLTYFVEESPLGTAGSVKNAQAFLDEPFVIVSGDSLTDMDLSRAIAFHQHRNADATLVLKRCDTPLEYGVVITDAEGRIQRFLEKPGWNEVFSDTVNTGIYILEPEVLDRVPAGESYDFGKDLFPGMLAEGARLYGHVSESYWCDIGDIEQYMQAQADCLDGRVDVSIPGRQLREGIWAEEGARISPKARLAAPCLIGRDAVVEDEAVLGAGCVIGEGSHLDSGCELNRTIAWDKVWVGRRSQVSGAVLCSHVHIEQETRIEADAVLGNGTLLMAGACVRDGARIWPDKKVEPGSCVDRNLVGGFRFRHSIFTDRGASGRVGIEITPETLAYLARAFVSQGAAATLAVAWWGLPSGRNLALALQSGGAFQGADVTDCGNIPLPMLRQGIRQLGLDCGVHVYVPGAQDRVAVLTFLGNRGEDIAKNVQRKIEGLFERKDFPSAQAQGQLSAVCDMPLFHQSALFGALPTGASVWKHQPSVVLSGNQQLVDWAARMLKARDCKVRVAQGGDLEHTVADSHADMGLELEGEGSGLCLVDDQGRRVDGWKHIAWLLLNTIRRFHLKKAPVPLNAPGWLEEMALDHDCQLVVTRTSRRALMEEVLRNGSEVLFGLYFDALFQALLTVEYAMLNGAELSRQLDRLPQSARCEMRIPCRDADKGRILGEIIRQETRGEPQLVEGMKIRLKGGWALILPDGEGPFYRVTVEGAEAEFAEEIAQDYARKIRSLQ